MIQKLLNLKKNLLIITIYITTPEFNKLTTENFTARLVQTNLMTKRDFDAKLQVLIEKLL